MLKNYDSFQAFLTDAKTGRKQYLRDRSDDYSSASFYGNASFDEALEMASIGWPEGTAKIESMTAAFSRHLTSLIEVPSIHFDVTGMDFDIGLLASGAPEHWYDIRNDTYVEGTGASIVKIVYNIGALGDVPASAMTVRGVAAASLITLLESTGRRVELYAFSKIHVYSEVGEYIVPVKRADESLDIDRLSFILAHPAMLRRLMWSVRRLHGPELKVGRGTSLDADDRGDIYFPAARSNDWWTEEKAKQFVTNALREQGVILGE